MFNEGDTVKLLIGEDAGKTATVYKVYDIGGVVSVAVKLTDTEIHMYKPEDLALV